MSNTNALFEKSNLPPAEAAFMHRVIPIIVDSWNLERQTRTLLENLQVEIARSKALREILLKMQAGRGG